MIYHVFYKRTEDSPVLDHFSSQDTVSNYHMLFSPMVSDLKFLFVFFRVLMPSEKLPVRL